MQVCIEKTPEKDHPIETAKKMELSNKSWDLQGNRKENLQEILAAAKKSHNALLNYRLHGIEPKSQLIGTDTTA